MEKRNGSMDAGYCHYLGHVRGIVVAWENNTVVDIDCEYQTCGLSSYCKLYNKHPIGYKFVPSPSKE